MTVANTDFGRVADDLRRAATAFAALTSSASAFGAALNTFRQFERQLTITNAIAGGTVAQFRQMEQASRTFALTTTTSATDAAAALQQLAQAGFTAEESLSAMAGVLLLSQATLTDVRVTSDVVSSNIRAFGLEAAETARVANVFTAAITGSLATMDKLAFALRQVAPVAEVANLSIEETTAFLGQLFNIGLRGEQAGTALRNIIVRLIRPLGEAGELLERAGIATRNTTGDLRNLSEILQDIGNSDLTDADLARIFETEALAGAIAAIRAVTVVTEDGTTAYERFLGEITGTDRALELAVQNLQTFDGALLLFNNTINDLLIEIGGALAPTIVSITEFIRDLAESFRDLDPSTQSAIAQFAGFGAALVGLLAIVNVLTLLLRGPLVAGFVALAARVVTSTTVVGAASAAYGVFAATLGGVVTAMTAAGRAMVVLAGQVRVALTALAAFSPAAPFILALAVAAAGAYALGEALEFVRDRADRANDADLSDLQDQLEFNRGQDYAESIADNILPDEAIDEIDRRITLLRRQVETAQAIMSGDPLAISGVADRSQVQAGSQLELLLDARDNLVEEGAAYAEILALRQSIVAQSEELANSSSALDRALSFFYSAEIERNTGTLLRDALSNLAPEDQGIALIYEERLAQLDAQIAAAEAAEAEFRSVEQQSIATFLTQLALGQAELEGELAIFAEDVRGTLSESPNLANIVAGFVARESDNPEDQREILRTLFSLEQDEQSLALLEELANQQVEARRSAITQAANILVQSNAEIQQEAYVSLLEGFIDSTNSVEEAILAAQEIANIEFQNSLRDVAGDLEGNFEDTITEFIGGTTQGIADILSSLEVEDLGDALPPSFSDLVSGAGLIEAVTERVNASTTPEELQAIIGEEQARYTAIFDSFVTALIAAGTLDPEQIEAIRAAAASSARAATSALSAGLQDISTSVDDTEAAVTRRISRGGGGGGGGEDVLRQARQIEDAYTSAADTIRRAQETLINASEGIGIRERAELLIDLDVDAVTAQFDAQLRRLERNLEDLQVDFNGTPEQLAELTEQYTTAIALTEQAREAEVNAARSFENSMQRRSDAIDLFIRDLQNLAFESNSSFAQVAAGIGIAFAEYQRDLVTLVDITTDAVTGFLDAITTGIADFVFDNENAFENFKATMLDISRDVFEAFTRSLIQQGISSLTGGGGSLFGNSTQPSLFGGDSNGESPSTGISGIFGNIFGGLFGGGQQQQQGGAPQVTQAANSVALALQQGAAQITNAFQLIGPQIQSAGGSTGASLQSAGTQIQVQGQVAAQGVSSAGTDLSSSLLTASSQIKGSSGGGGGGFLSALFGPATSLFFAQGGLAANRQTENMLRAFADGGRVNGAGTGTSDDILAYLSNGEYVVKAAMTREFLPILEAINNGRSKKELAALLLGSSNAAPSASGSSISEFKNAIAGFAEGGLVQGNPFIANASEPIITVIDRAGRQSLPNVSNNTNKKTEINLSVNYVMQGSDTKDPSRAFKKSGDQQAKNLAEALSRMQRNT